MKIKNILILTAILPLLSCYTQEKRYSIYTPKSTTSFKSAERKYSENEKTTIKNVLKEIENEFKNIDVATKIDFFINDLHLQIIFDKQDWTKNININIHNQGAPGFEMISPEIVINDSKLKIDYCWFYGKNCLIPLETVENIIRKIYGL